MDAEILAVGSEILLGNITNTNATFISQELSALGINVYHHSVVGDNPARLAQAVEQALKRCDLLITTGGLGPTYDDLTKDTVAAALGLKMELHEDILQDLYNTYRHYGKTFPQNNEKQAYFPRGAVILPNDWGSAPSCAVQKDGKTVILLPGPPHEMQHIWRKYVVPFLLKDSDCVLVSRFCRVYGIGESSLEERLYDLLKNSVNPTVAPYASAAEVMLRVTAKAADYDEAFALTEPVVETIRREVGDQLYGVDKDCLAQVVTEMLLDLHLTVAVEENITCGLVAQKLAEQDEQAQCFIHGTICRAKESRADAKPQADILLSVGDEIPFIDPKAESLSQAEITIDGPLGRRSFLTPPRRNNDKEYFKVLTASRALDRLRLYLLELSRSKGGNDRA